jgi:hypothetical protein
MTGMAATTRALFAGYASRSRPDAYLSNTLAISNVALA